MGDWRVHARRGCLAPGFWLMGASEELCPLGPFPIHVLVGLAKGGVVPIEAVSPSRVLAEGDCVRNLVHGDCFLLLRGVLEKGVSHLSSECLISNLVNCADFNGGESLPCRSFGLEISQKRTKSSSGTLREWAECGRME